MPEADDCDGKRYKRSKREKSEQFSSFSLLSKIRFINKSLELTNAICLRKITIAKMSPWDEELGLK